MRIFISASSAAVTALIVGVLIGTVSNAARAGEIAHAQTVQQEQRAAALADARTAADLAAYRDRLQEALVKLDAAYRDLATRDAAYRDLLAKSQGQVSMLQSENARLAAQLEAVHTELVQLSNRSSGSTPSTGSWHDDD